MLGISFSKNSTYQVGVDFMPTGVAVVDVARGEKNLGQVRHCDFLPAVGITNQSAVLKQWVSQKGLKNAPCVGLIAKHDVQLFQLEKPAVEHDEILQAVSWKIKDLISFDIDTAVIDVFELPPSSKSPASHVNAVVANESVVSSYVDLIKQFGLELKVLDVHDLVSKNYTSLHDFSDQTVSILQFSANDGMLSIYRNNDLYVARDFKIGLLDIEAKSDARESVYESLLLELQRSMDYFESSYALGMVQKLIIFPQTIATERMASYLQNQVGYEIDFTRIDFQGEQQPVNPHCFAAYCAALRKV